MIALNAVLPIFIVIMSGYLIRQHFIKEESFWFQADRLVYNILLPLMLMHTTSGFVYEPTILKDGVLVFALVSLMAALCFGLRRFVPMNDIQFTSVFQGVVRPNFYISLSIAFLLYGREGMQFLSFILMFLIMSATVYSVLVLDRYGSLGGRGGGLARAARRLSRNPIILSTLAGAVIGFGFGGLPEFLDRTCDIFGRATLPLALLGVGATLEFAALGRYRAQIAMATILRLLIAPLLCLIAVQFMALSPMEATCILLLFAVPSAASAITFASQMGGDVKLMSLILTAQTVTSFVTLSVVLSLAQSGL